MAANSLLSCNSCCLGIKLRPSSSSPRSSLISRRGLLPRPITISASSTPLGRAPILLVEMQSSTNESSSTSIAQEETKSISSAGENQLASTKNTGLINFFQLSTLVNLPIWAKLVLGSVFLLGIPFLRKTLNIKDVAKKVEEVAELVETVAEVTEKVAEDIAGALPDGKLKDEALKLEKIALLIDKNAEVAESFIDKVNDAVKEVDTDLKPILEGKVKKNDGEEKIATKKIVVDQSKEAL